MCAFYVKYDYNYVQMNLMQRICLRWIWATQNWLLCLRTNWKFVKLNAPNMGPSGKSALSTSCRRHWCSTAHICGPPKWLWKSASCPMKRWAAAHSSCFLSEINSGRFSLFKSLILVSIIYGSHCFHCPPSFTDNRIRYLVGNDEFM